MESSRGDPPVVSRSTAQNVTSDSGTPSSSVVWMGSDSTAYRLRRWGRTEPNRPEQVLGLSRAAGDQWSGAGVEGSFDQRGEQLLDGQVALLDVGRHGG